MKGPQTLQQAIQFFSDYENCRQFMVAVRWADGKVRCPYCNSEKVTYLEKARLYRCYGKHLKQKFSLKIGTVYEDSPIPLEKWLPATWLLVELQKWNFLLRDWPRYRSDSKVGMVHDAPY